MYEYLDLLVPKNQSLNIPALLANNHCHHGNVFSVTMTRMQQDSSALAGDSLHDYEYGSPADSTIDHTISHFP